MRLIFERSIQLLSYSSETVGIPVLQSYDWCYGLLPITDMAFSDWILLLPCDTLWYGYTEMVTRLLCSSNIHLTYIAKQLGFVILLFSPCAQGGGREDLT